jgi:ubiquinol-cytochrome c reductase cytochrome c1 subunit
MKLFHRLLIACVGAVAIASPSLAAGEYKKPEDHTWQFEGPFGTFDRAAMQRGFQVYQEVCAACHGMRQLAFRHLGDPGAPFEMDGVGPNDNPIVRAIAAQYIISDLDDIGEAIERPGRPTDRFPDPFANPQQAAASNGGAVPPDLSVIIKARKQGPEYVRSLMLGYDYEQDPEHPVELRPGQYFNPYMSGQIIAMPPQLQDGLIEYADGTEATKEQMAHDLVSFLTWASEQHMEARKRMGLMVMIYLLILSGLLYAAYRQVWANVKH